MSAILSTPTTRSTQNHLKLVTLPAGFGFPESESQQPLNDQTLSALLDALATAEPLLKNQIEDILVDLAPVITDTLLHGLTHDNIHVRSTSAMVLIRTGRIHLTALHQFLAKTTLNNDARWAADFVMEHLA